MADVILSSAVRNNLLSLQNTADLLAKTQERLATGLRVNSALDDPTAFFTAQSLNSRAGDLNRLLDSVGLAVQTLSAADTAIQAITDLVETAQATARQALQSALGTFGVATLTGSGASLSADAAGTITGTENIGAENNFIANTAITEDEELVLTINGVNQTIVFGTSGGAEVNTAAELEAAIDALTGVEASYSGGQLVITGESADDTFSINASTGANVLTVIGVSSGQSETGRVNLLTQGAVSSGETLTVQIGSGATETITFGTGGGQVSTLAELNTALDALTGVDTGSTQVNTSNGNITIVGANAGDSITVGGTVTLSNFGISAGTTTPSVTTSSTARSNLQTQFNGLLTQIDQLAADATFNGNNLLQSDSLQVIFNERGTSSLTITGVNFNASGLDITTVAGDSFQHNANINASLAELDAAIASLRSQAATFGSNLSVVETRQSFTKNLINTLETGAANLTLADTNQEGANLLALQARQQLSSVALSLAASADQNVLRLF